MSKRKIEKGQIHKCVHHLMVFVYLLGGYELRVKETCKYLGLEMGEARQYLQAMGCVPAKASGSNEYTIGIPFSVATKRQRKKKAAIV